MIPPASRERWASRGRRQVADGAGISWRPRAGRAPIMHFGLQAYGDADTVADAFEAAIVIVERE